MKWGVRKGHYWTETQDKVGGNYTDRQKKRMTRQAKSILNKQIKRSNNIANVYAKDASRAYKKADKLTLKAGRDYVTNKRSSTNLALSALGIVNWSTEKCIDFRK